jgi:seryl-tRNA synthetase
MDPKEFERIARLETHVENMAESVERIETKLDAYTANFLPRTEAEVRFEKVESEIKEVKNSRKANAALIVSIASVAVVFIFNLINVIN